MKQECQFWLGVTCHAPQSFINTRLFSSLFQQGAWPKATVPGKEIFCPFLATQENPTNHLWANIPRAFRNAIQSAQQRQSGEGHRLPPLKHHWKYTHTHLMYESCTGASIPRMEQEMQLPCRSNPGTLRPLAANTGTLQGYV